MRPTLLCSIRLATLVSARLATLVSLIACALACTRAAPQVGLAASNGTGEVVARVDGVPIYASDVASEVRRGGGPARAALDRLIDFELLAASAAPTTSPATDPDVAEARDQIAVQLLVERELETHLGKDAIPDDVLRDLYQKALSVFVHPRLVEVALLIVYTGARMKDQPRADAIATARALETYVRDKPATPEDWKAMAAQPAWRDRKVQFTRTWQALDEPFPIEVGRAVATLRHPGDTTPLVVNEMGCFLACYISERPPENVAFEQARDRLRDQVYERWKKAQFLEFAQTAANPHRIEAYPERFTPEAVP
jgi:hypothetical protein